MLIFWILLNAQIILYIVRLDLIFMSIVLKQVFYTRIIPNPFVTSFFYGGTSFGNSPESFWDWRGIVQIHIGEVFFDSVRCFLRLVMRNSGIEMMSNMGSANLVM
mmetsp:Transcript_4697/g.7315  ORF Transcript_4697/g.7315 Transcript_4697/m.7315 type:complete len:105 (-) Transcript_4697:240-554(-)